MISSSLHENKLQQECNVKRINIKKNKVSLAVTDANARLLLCNNVWKDQRYSHWSKYSCENIP